MQKPDSKFIAEQLRKPHGAYAIEIAGFMSKANRKMYDMIFQEIKLQPNDRILELGPADGSFVENLFQLESTLHYTGVDFSEEMIQAANLKNQHRLNEQNVSFVHSTFADFTGSKKFDKIFSVNTVYFWDDVQPLLLHLKSQLSRGGLLLLAFRTGESMKQMPFTEYGFKFFEAKDLTKALTDAGFHAIHHVSASESIVLPDGSDASLSNVCVVASH